MTGLDQRQVAWPGLCAIHRPRLGDPPFESSVTHYRRSLIQLATISTLLSMRTSATARLPDRVSGPDQIQVDIVNLRTDRGTVYCSIYRASGDGFPTVLKKAAQFAHSKVANRRARCNFNDLGPGVFAVGMVHDENDNHKLDTNWMGLPVEGYGVSRDAIRSLSTPRFKDAAFSYGGGTVRIVVHVHY